MSQQYFDVSSDHITHPALTEMLKFYLKLAMSDCVEAKVQSTPKHIMSSCEVSTQLQEIDSTKIFLTVS